MKSTLRAILVALGVAGMLSVAAWADDNHSAGEVLDDSVITTKIKAALVADPTTKAHQISVDTFKGSVKLSGFVDGSEAEQRAIEIARDVEGVREVDAELEVRQ